MATFRMSRTSSVFRHIPSGTVFQCLSEEFAVGLCPESPLDGATLYIKRSDTVVAAFDHQGVRSYPIGSDYGDIEVVPIPFPPLVRVMDEDLWRALRVLTQPYA